MKENISRKNMYQENTIAVKHVNDKRDYPSCGGLAGVQDYVTKNIERVKYLKICWNCGATYESLKHNSFACKLKCRQNLMYKLNRGINPPVIMKIHLKDKNIVKLKEMFGYL